jgi:hypothetical protein
MHNARNAAPDLPSIVLYRSDLLYGVVSFSNLRIDPATTHEIVASDPSQPVYVILQLPSQHFTEFPGDSTTLYADNPSKLIFVGDHFGRDVLRLRWLERVFTSWPLSTDAGVATQIEWQYKLLLTPLGSSVKCELTRAKADNWTTLWHLRLREQGLADGIDAQFSVAVDTSRKTTTLPTGGPILTDDERNQVAALSSQGVPLNAKRMIVTAIGAIADASIVRPGAVGLKKRRRSSQLDALAERTALGRQNWWKVATRIAGYPLPHWFSLVEIFQRQAANGVASLVPHYYIQLNQPAVEFSGQYARQLGFTKIVVSTGTGTALSREIKLPVPVSIGTQTAYRCQFLDGSEVTWNVTFYDFNNKPLVTTPVALTYIDDVFRNAAAGPNNPLQIALQAYYESLIASLPVDFGHVDALIAESGGSNADLFLLKLIMESTIDNDVKLTLRPLAKQLNVVSQAIQTILGSEAANIVASGIPIKFDANYIADAAKDVFANALSNINMILLPADTQSVAASLSASLQQFTKSWGAVAGTFDTNGLFQLGADIQNCKILNIFTVGDLFAALKLQPDIPPGFSVSRNGDAVTVKYEFKKNITGSTAIPAVSVTILAGLFDITATVTVSPGATPQRTVKYQLPQIQFYLLPGFPVMILTLGDKNTGITITYSSESGVSVNAPIAGIQLEGSIMTALKDLDSWLTTSQLPAISLDKDAINLNIGTSFPSLSLGAFAIRNLVLRTGMKIPILTGTPSLNFQIADSIHQFTVAVGILAGFGYFELDGDLTGSARLSGGIGFGGTLALDLFLASGSISAQADFEYALDTGNPKADKVTGTLMISGNLSVLGIISVDAYFYLSMTYRFNEGLLEGEAVFHVEAHIFFFSLSLDLHCSRSFPVSSQRAIASVLADKPIEDWLDEKSYLDYCAAFV